MIKLVRRWSGDQSLGQTPKGRRNILSRRRAAPLIVHNANLIARLRQPHHGARKIMALRGIDPGQPNDHRLRMGRAHGLFPGPF